MIIRGGENISPSEIEEVLLAHPAVADAVCFGDRRRASTASASARPSRSSGDASERELIELLPRAAGRVQGAAR